MTDYKKMYSIMFNAVTDAINIFQEAQKATEEIYISGDDSLPAEPDSNADYQVNDDKR